MPDDLQIRYLGDLQRLNLSPGDILVFSSAAHMTDVAKANVVERLGEAIGKSNRILVLDEGDRIGVLGKE